MSDIKTTFTEHLNHNCVKVDQGTMTCVRATTAINFTKNHCRIESNWYSWITKSIHWIMFPMDLQLRICYKFIIKFRVLWSECDHLLIQYLLQGKKNSTFKLVVGDLNTIWKYTKFFFYNLIRLVFCSNFTSLTLTNK